MRRGKAALPIERKFWKKGISFLIYKGVWNVLEYQNGSRDVNRNDHVDSDDLTNHYPIIDSLKRAKEISLISESGLAPLRKRYKYGFDWLILAEH